MVSHSFSWQVCKAFHSLDCMGKDINGRMNKNTKQTRDRQEQRNGSDMQTTPKSLLQNCMMDIETTRFHDITAPLWLCIFHHTACFKHTPHTWVCEALWSLTLRDLIHAFLLTLLCVCFVFLYVLTGGAVRDETDNTDKVALNKPVSAAVKKAALAGGQKAIVSSSGRPKRKVGKKGKT